MNRLFLFIFTLLTLASCDDNDSFTTSPSYLLTLGTDTVKMDTVFSTVPVATRSFWVYNHSGENIRCSNVRLQNGNQSGFRVNVHGFDLGEKAGFQAGNIEIRNKDSIHVFVELTAKETHQLDPKKVEDNIIFQLESGVQQKVNLNAMAWDADIVDSIILSKDSIIDNFNGKPLIIRKGIKICEGSTLTIAAGSTLYFHDTAGIEVFGKLLCNGTAEHNINLRCDRIDNMFDYLPYENLSGRWQGIVFKKDSYDNVIDFTDIHGGTDGIVCDSSNVENTKLSISNSTIHNCMGYGLKAYSSKIVAQNCQFTNTLGDCVSITGGNITLTHCTLAQFYPFNAHRGAALSFTNTYNGFDYPLTRMQVRNSIITGYAEDVIMGNRSEKEETPFNYSFAWSLLRTPNIEDAEGIPEGAFENITWEEKEEEDIVIGEKNFVKVDIDLLRYDFHLDSLSRAIGSANMEWALPRNKDGKKHEKESANMGCY